MGMSHYSSLKVLIIDDFGSFRMALSRMLSDLGCEQVVTAMNGEVGLDICRKQHFDVVMCDYGLGDGANGQQVLEALRYNKILPRESLFLLISAESSQSIVLSVYDYAPDAYLTKPITAKSLRQRLDRLLLQRQEMLPLYRCLDSDDMDGAIAIAESAIASSSRYATVYQRMLGEFYLQCNQIEDAEALYTRVLEARPLDWARVGLSKVKKAQGDLETSTAWLSKILDDNPFCMQAYDVLAENYRDQHDLEKVQQTLEAAVEMSPLSILRQVELAETAANNLDYPIATKAYGRSVRLGEHSCHDRCHNHLQYGRLAAAWMRDSVVASAQDLIKDGLRVLEQVPRRFELSPDQKAQAHLLECQLYVARKEEAKALALLNETEEMIKELSLGLDLQLDRVATMSVLGKEDAVTELLTSLVEEYAEDQEALQRIDLWLEEPVSEHNKKLVSQLNNQGIEFYQANDYGRALDSFKRACRLFPHHLGVQLNLFQALTAEMKAFGKTEETEALCRALSERIEPALVHGSPEMNRFRQLQQLARTLD